MFSFTAIEKEMMISTENLNQKVERTHALLSQTYGLLQNIFPSSEADPDVLFDLSVESSELLNKPKHDLASNKRVVKALDCVLLH